MNNSLIVSICIPCYNSPETFIRLFNSIRIQTFHNYEIVITDDSCDDCIKNVISNYEAEQRLIYVKNEIRLGAVRNCNKALTLASGKYIKIMHDDDWFSAKDSLVKFVNMMNSDDKVVLAFSGSNEVSTDSMHSRSISDAKMERMLETPFNLIYGNYIGAPSATIFKKNNLQFDEKLRWIVDIDFYIQMLKLNNNFAETREALVNIGINSEQETNACKHNKSLVRKEFFYLCKKYKLFRYKRYWHRILETVVYGRDY